MVYYFVYKPKLVGNLGGIMPLPIEGVEYGIASYDRFFVGKTDDPLKTLPIKDFILTWIDEETAKGFSFIGVDNVIVQGVDGEETRPLTEEEQAWKAKAERIIKKLKDRTKIYGEVQDLEDIIADLNKRIELLEVIISKLISYVVDSETVSSEDKTLLDTLKAIYMDNNYKKRIDAYDDWQALLQTLLVRNSEIASLLP